MPTHASHSDAPTAATVLPRRPGPRPLTSSRSPHQQLDQQPAQRKLTDEVIDRARSWPDVGEQASGISTEHARALVLDTAAATDGPDAFMIGREFCHAHGGGDGSFHATLPVELARDAAEAGWAEPHVLVASGQVPPTIVLLYAPRDEAERDVVLRLVQASYRFATQHDDTKERSR